LLYSSGVDDAAAVEKVAVAVEEVAVAVDAIQLDEAPAKDW
jgi:hypothetical protein